MVEQEFPDNRLSRNHSEGFVHKICRGDFPLIWFTKCSSILIAASFRAAGISVDETWDVEAWFSLNLLEVMCFAVTLDSLLLKENSRHPPTFTQGDRSFEPFTRQKMAVENSYA